MRDLDGQGVGGSSTAARPHGTPFDALSERCFARWGDSAALTAAAVANAQPGLRGATMAVHSTIGFAGAAMGPVVFGYLLDAGGRDNPQAWFYAFGFMAALSILSIVLIRTLKPRSAIGDRDLS